MLFPHSYYSQGSQDLLRSISRIKVLPQRKSEQKIFKWNHFIKIKIRIENNFKSYLRKKQTDLNRNLKNWKWKIQLRGAKWLYREGSIEQWTFPLPWTNSNVHINREQLLLLDNWGLSEQLLNNKQEEDTKQRKQRNWH